MASGNMGDLSMTLTLKSRMEDEVKKIVDQLNKLDESGKKAQGALEKIRDSVSGVKGADGLKQIEKDLAKIGQRMSELRSEEVPDMSTIKKLETLSSGYIRVFGHHERDAQPGNRRLEHLSKQRIQVRKRSRDSLPETIQHHTGYIKAAW